MTSRFECCGKRMKLREFPKGTRAISVHFWQCSKCGKCKPCKYGRKVSKRA